MIVVFRNSARAEPGVMGLGTDSEFLPQTHAFYRILPVFGSVDDRGEYPKYRSCLCLRVGQRKLQTSRHRALKSWLRMVVAS